MGIRTLDTAMALDRVRDELIYTEARQRAAVETGNLAEEMAAMTERVGAIEKEQSERRRQQVLAQAQVDAVDADLDAWVDALAVTLGSITRRNFDDPLWQRYFGNRTPYLLRRLGLESEMQRVRGWARSLQEQQEPDLLELGRKLEAILVAGDQAVAQRREAIRRRADHRAEIPSLFDDINALRLAHYGALLAIAAETRKDRAWAEGFFRRGTRSTARRVDEPADAPAPSP